MLEFGEKVIIKDKALKCHNHIGVYVGDSIQGLGKVYLECPLQGKKTKVAVAVVNKEKIYPFGCEISSSAQLDKLRSRIDDLNEIVNDIGMMVGTMSVKLV